MKGAEKMNTSVPKLLSGPAGFAAAGLLLNNLLGFSGALAVGTAVWMALWWIFRPVHIAVTSLLPIAVNAAFTLIPNAHVIEQYFTDIVVLLLGGDLICMAWTTTGLDRRISLRTLCLIGTSLRQQIFVWLSASVVLSAFLPNTVVATIFCPIAVGMLQFVGEKNISSSRLAVPILLAISWGSGIGGFGSPIGSPANLVAISYMEELTGHEFMYVQWIGRFVPILFIIFLCNLLFLWHLKTPAKNFHGTREEFQKMYAELGPMRKGERICFWLFILAILLAFARPLYAAFLPGLKPAYVFLIIGMLMFILRDEKGEVLLTWNFAESHAMWGIMIMASSGLGLGRMIIETGAVGHMAEFLGALHLTGGFVTMFLFCAFACFMSEMSSNTGAASICIPMVISLCGALELNPVPYTLGTVAACSCAYVLPVTTRAIPVGFGLDASVQMREGLKLTLICVVVNATLCWLSMEYLPLFSHL